MRAGFVTCVRLGLSCMEEIYKLGGALELAITLPDDIAKGKSGRVFIDEFCSSRGIDLHIARNINDPKVADRIRAHRIDWLFIIGWSQIAKARVLEAPRRGALGMHPTLLPIGRGRAAIPWTIIKGLTTSGVTLFKLDEGVDTGPIVAQVELAIDARETATTLYERTGEAHRQLIQRAWPDLVAENLCLHEQDESAATVWPGRKPGDGAIDLSMSLERVDRLVRATTRPYPGAFVNAFEKRYRIWAGAVRADTPSPTAVEVHGGELRLPLSDGLFVASDWDVEHP